MSREEFSSVQGRSSQEAPPSPQPVHRAILMGWLRFTHGDYLPFSAARPSPSISDSKVHHPGVTLLRLTVILLRRARARNLSTACTGGRLYLNHRLSINSCRAYAQPHCCIYRRSYTTDLAPACTLYGVSCATLLQLSRNRPILDPLGICMPNLEACKTHTYSRGLHKLMQPLLQPRNLYYPATQRLRVHCYSTIVRHQYCNKPAQRVALKHGRCSPSGMARKGCADTQLARSTQIRQIMADSSSNQQIPPA
ncbi:hypothetical protein CC80DRAFT_33969 [Byssothecium circinans]|uniref:Uncharacterized protein n=1 Tax=Byssothecium circinans TaxID=147558 RepID=A0A6A5TY57_9PLEO|nr:hypothetical protein CC80DRAFT_33969 [Byssothecium circinans]